MQQGGATKLNPSTMSKLVSSLLRPCLQGLLVTSALLGASTVSAADSLSAAVAEGKPNLTFRPRYEYGDQAGLKSSNAVTLKTLLGYTTAPYLGFTAGVEFTDTHALDDDGYNAAGLNGQPGKTVIADPETTELNQLYLQYKQDIATGKLGRQRIIYDNARMVGNVGWRQNEQTFDAALLRVEPVKGLVVDYAYLNRVNRIFADSRDWDSDSHLVHATYAVSKAFSVTGYAYLLDFTGNGASTTDTYGAIVAGSQELENVKLTYRAEGAFQNQDALDVDTHYVHLQGGAEVAGFKFGLGYELLGSDSGKGQFLTPLATAHAFNGFADAYLDNGGKGGLQDLYASVGYKIEKLNATVWYHDFSSDEGKAADGSEVDLVLTYPLHKKVTALVKIALYDGDTRADVNRFITELTITY